MAWYIGGWLWLTLLAPAAVPGGAIPPAGEAADEDSSTRLNTQSSVDDILESLHEAGRDLRTLRANVVLTDIDTVMLNDTQRPGEVFLRTDDSGTAFRVVLRGVVVQGADGRPGLRPEKIEYLLRNDELVDRNYKTRTQTIHRLPPEERQRNLLKLGEGPFPLPIGQSPEDVRRQFQVREVDPADPQQNTLEVDPAPGSRRLRLTPLPNTALADDFAWIEIDVTLSTGMPAKVITLGPTGENARVTDLRSIQINADLPADAFNLEPIDPREWEMRVEDVRRQESAPAAAPRGR